MARLGAGNAYRGHENVGPLRHGAGISHQAVEALFSAPPVPSKGFHGVRSMMCFESFNVNAAGEVGQYPAHNQYEILDDMLDDDADEYGAQRAEKKRRLTADQVQFLEKSFEVENKLEPERKVQLAKDVGLQPRQVAIWFQNRRARWKTKQIEKDYEALQLSFSTLKNDHDHLLREKEELKAEVQAIKGKLLLQENGDFGNNSSNSASSALVAVPAPPPLSPPLQLPPLPGKPDDLCSANSAILDYESPHQAEEAWHSDLSQPEEDEGERMEGGGGGGSGSYGEFGSSDLWFWPYH